MNYLLTNEQVDSYQQNGFLVIDNFLSAEELEDWRATVMEAVRQRGGQKMPGKEGKTGEDDGINEDTEYFGKVFDQLINLWQTHASVKRLMTDARLGEMAARLAGGAGFGTGKDKPY